MDREEKAFEFAQEAVKQVLTLSTGIIALTLTFLKDVVPKGTDFSLLQWAWGFYVGAILLGLLAMLAMTGTLGKASGNVNGGTIRVFATGELVLFFVGVVLTLFFGFKVF